MLHHLSDGFLQRIAALQHQPGDDEGRGAADALAAVHEDPTSSGTGQRLLDKLRGGGKVLKERVDGHIERLNAHEGDAGVAVVAGTGVHHPVVAVLAAGGVQHVSDAVLSEKVQAESRGAGGGGGEKMGNDGKRCCVKWWEID